MPINKKIFIILIILTSITPNLKVLVFTQNQGGLINKLKKKITNLSSNFLDFKKKFQSKVLEKNADVIIYTIQELIELKPLALFSKDKTHGIQNFAGLAKKNLNTEKECNYLKKILKEMFPLYKIKYNSNLSMVTFVLVKKNIDFKIKTLKAVNENGKFKKFNFNHGFWGQKGGLISLIEVNFGNEYFKLISINAHLDSKSSDVRFRQYVNLLENTRNIVEGKIENYSIFFSGDMNSRLSQVEKDLIRKNFKEDTFVEKYGNLVENFFRSNLDFQFDNRYDKFEEFNNYLNLKQIYHMEEEMILFPPTYKLKFKKGMNCWLKNFYKNCYDDKKLNFAYTDRIFYFTTSNQVFSPMSPTEDYNILLSQLISDHHTVFGFFEISIVNEEIKDFEKISFSVGKSTIKNDNAIEELKNLLKFIDPNKNDETNNKFLEILNFSDFFFINSTNIYNYLKIGEPECVELEGNEDKIIFFFEIKKIFLNCYNLIQSKKFHTVLNLVEIENDENEDQDQDQEDEIDIKKEILIHLTIQDNTENSNLLENTKINQNNIIEEYFGNENIDIVNDLIDEEKTEEYFNQHFGELLNEFMMSSQITRKLKYKNTEMKDFSKNKNNSQVKIESNFENDLVIKGHNEDIFSEKNNENFMDNLETFQNTKRNRNVQIMKRNLTKGIEDKIINKKNQLKDDFEDNFDIYKNERQNKNRMNFVIKRKIII